MSELIESDFILIVEDSDDDYEFISDTLCEDLPNSVQVVRCINGADAIDILQKNVVDTNSASCRCRLITLDLNLPGVCGREVLSYVKSSRCTKSIPVVVLTTSNNDMDVSSCYQLGANSYVQKPVDLGRFVDALEQLKNYWLNLSVQPVCLKTPVT